MYPGESTSWPRKDRRRYWIIPSICFNCESACGVLAFRAREMLVWPTGGRHMNAAVVGVLPRARYVFFTDPTYPETNLVVVRKKGASGFADVNLDCAGKIEGWKKLTDDLQYTRVDLVRHDGDEPRLDAEWRETLREP